MEEVTKVEEIIVIEEIVEVDRHHKEKFIKINPNTQADVEIELEDNRKDGAIFGVVENKCGDPIKGAIVRLLKVEREYVKNVFKPVSHTFTDCRGEFSFGPLCEGYYIIKVYDPSIRIDLECIKIEIDPGVECLRAKGPCKDHCWKPWEKYCREEIENGQDCPNRQ